MRYIGALLVIGGFILIGYEGWQWLGAEGDEPFRLLALGEWWFAIDKSSFLSISPAIERHVPGGPWIYENIVQPVLGWPAAVEAILLGFVLIIISRVRP